MRRAFTILELLATTALTAVLMVAVMSVIGSLGRGQRALARQSETGQWRDDLLDMLRRDLGNSTVMRIEPAGVVLIGHASIDRETFSPGHSPVTITYSLAIVHGRSWLIRRQAARDGMGEWSELVCPDVASFSVRPSTATFDGKIDTKSEQAVPAAVIVRMERTDGGSIEELLTLR